MVHVEHAFPDYAPDPLGSGFPVPDLQSKDVPTVSGNGRVLRSVALIAAGTALTAGAALPAVASAPTAAGPTVQPTSTRTAPSIAALDAAAAASNRRAVATCQTAAKAGIVLYWARVAVQTASTTETRTDDGIAKAREQIARAAADRTGAVCAAARAKAVSRPEGEPGRPSDPVEVRRLPRRSANVTQWATGFPRRICAASPKLGSGPLEKNRATFASGSLVATTTINTGNGWLRRLPIRLLILAGQRRRPVRQHG